MGKSNSSPATGLSLPGIVFIVFLILKLTGLTIPQIADNYPEYTYDQVYDTIYCDKEFNLLYRKHGQMKIKKVKK